MGAYAEKITRGRTLTAEQIRRNKCERSKGRNATRKAERIEAANERLREWRKLSPKDQLKALDGRRGNSKKQRAKILEKMNEG